jgi:hypothetical protein
VPLHFRVVKRLVDDHTLSIRQMTEFIHQSSASLLSNTCVSFLPASNVYSNKYIVLRCIYYLPQVRKSHSGTDKVHSNCRRRTEACEFSRAKCSCQQRQSRRRGRLIAPHRYELKPLGSQTPTRATTRVSTPRHHRPALTMTPRPRVAASSS